MRILIVTQIFLPEMGALSNRLYPIVRELIAAGHEVTVATGMPNYPAGKVFPEYRGRLFQREKEHGCNVIRTAYLTVPRNKSRLSQLMSYLSFIPAVFVSGLRAGKIDVVFVTAPPPFPVLAAVQLARLRGSKLVFDIRDLWSDELVAYGGVGNDSAPVRLVRRIERLGYRKADLVTCTTKSLMETVVDRGAARDKTVFFPNGADLEIFNPLPPDNEVANSYGLKDKFVVMYSGLFGIKHGLDMLVETAELLRHEPNIVFFLIGNGARREALLKQVEAKKLTNVIIANERQVNDIPHVIARANVCFAATQPAPYPNKLISVKIFEYMACEKPLIGAFEGESAQVINESGGGIVVTPGNTQAVANAVMDLYRDPERCAEMGRVGRAYVEKFYSRSNWASKFEGLLQGLIKSPVAGQRVLASEAE
jgi:glycosyltransferase involved in cell wall biosynthesis